MAVFKIRRPSAQWKSPEVPEFYENYYFKIRDSNGKQLLRNAATPRKEDAEKVEAAAKRKVKADGFAALLEALEPVKMRRTCATLGNISEAYLSEAVKIVKDAKMARRNVADLIRVVATAQDLWTVAGRGLRGVAPGTRIPDVGKVEALSASILTAELVRKYYRVRQGGLELDVNSRTEANRSINSTLGHARDVFSRRAMAYKLGKLSLPDLSGFLKEPGLPEADAEPEPLTAEEWDTMVAAAAALKDRELALVNELLRSTGLRSKELVNAHSAWLVAHGSGWALEIRDREEMPGKQPAFSQKGVRARKVPLRPELAEILRKRKGYLIATDAPKTVREELVNQRHNEFIKGIIGGLGEKTQGNHRLRDTVCSALWTLHGPAAAQDAAGHVDPKTTAKHYAKRMSAVADGMRAEINAWTGAINSIH